jgi:methionyl-tRNA formyltransferase
MAAVSIHNLVRGLTHPYVGAHFELGGDDIKVWRTAVEGDVPPNLEPGKVLDTSAAGALIKAGIGAVRLLEIEPSVTLQPGSYL